MARKITLLYVDAGGGHRAAATALMDAIRIQRRPWDVEAVCIQDVFDSVDFIQQATGIRFQDVYNIMLRRGWTLCSAQMIRLMHGVIRMSHARQVSAFRDYWRGTKPDMVVSLIPHFNRAIREALSDVWPDVPYITVLTDIADYPPHFWMEPMDQYVVCGSERAERQARAIGLPEARIFRASGMILHPRFYENTNMNRDMERAHLGLKPDVPTGLVLFGGEGSAEMVEIAKALRGTEPGVQLIMLCGKNAKVAAQLRAMNDAPDMFVQGFTRDIPSYMALADFFIGKPGPGSISEALSKGLPVIVRRNIRTLAHERYNADWVEEQGVGLVARNPAGIRRAVETILAPENCVGFRERVASVRNEAVFEIPAMLERVLETTVPEDSRVLTLV